MVQWCIRNRAKPLVLYSYSTFIISLFFFDRIDGRIVALKEIRLHNHEGLPFTAIREGYRFFYLLQIFRENFFLKNIHHFLVRRVPLAYWISRKILPGNYVVLQKNILIASIIALFIYLCLNFGTSEPQQQRFEMKVYIFISEYYLPEYIFRKIKFAFKQGLEILSY